MNKVNFKSFIFIIEVLYVFSTLSQLQRKTVKITLKNIVVRFYTHLIFYNI